MYTLIVLQNTTCDSTGDACLRSIMKNCLSLLINEHLCNVYSQKKEG